MNKIKLTEIITAALIFTTGAFLLITGLDVFSFDISRVWLISLYVCMLLSSACCALVQKNRLAASICGLFFVLTIAQSVVLCGFKHSEIYPLYIAAVPFAAIIGSLGIKALKGIFFISILLFVSALALLLSSFGLLSVAIVLPALLMFWGLAALIYSLIKPKLSKEKLK